LTTHSLEPHRPWKFEQLGSAYYASSWMEKTAYENADGVIAVSESMKEDVRNLYRVPDDRIRVIHNGIDGNEYRPQVIPGTLERLGIDSRKPFVLFVGRITRQKGIFHLLNAIPHLKSNVQIVLCAGAADTQDLESEMSRRVEQVRAHSGKEIVWIPHVVPKPDIFSIYSAAALFVCPSIYEPFGIINLEAMACGTPVVASAVGGIPEIVVHEQTGMLVPFAPVGTGNPEPADPDKFARDLASAIDYVVSSPENLESMGRKARKRVEDRFSWESIARRTLDFYRAICDSKWDGA
jgi:starch synthase